MNTFSQKKFLFKVLEFAFILCMFVAMLNRIQYGIEFSDESWYVAEPYAVAELGLVPFVNNVTQAPGFTLPLALAFKLYVWLNSSSVGIVLFSRIFYLCFHFIISSLTVWIVNRYTSFKIPLLAIGALVTINHCFSLYDVNYNTIGMMYLPLIFALVFAEYEDNTRRSFWWGFLAGVLSVRTVMGSPTVMVGLVVVLLYLFIQRQKKRIAGILAGAGGTCLVVFLWVFVGCGGIERFFYWLQMFLAQSYFAIESGVHEERTRNALIDFFKYPLMLVCVVVAARALLKEKTDIFDLFLRFAIVGGIVVGVALTIRSHAYYYVFYLMRLTWVLPFLYCLFAHDQRIRRINIVVICLAYLSVFFVASFHTVSGFPGHRGYWNYVPMLIAVCCLVQDGDFEVSKGVKFLRSLLFVIGISTLSIYGLWNNYSHIYRDAPKPSLLTQVEDGIWKGLYTTGVRAKSVVVLEQYIKSVTNAEDSVICLDWVSFGYLMTNGKICAPSTLDIAVYSYKVNSPRPYYMYFQAEHTVPDKIIYIDYGRDKHLSIDDGQWKFNELVWRHYHFVDAYRNDLFYVRVYALDDREGALRLVEKTLNESVH